MWLHRCAGFLKARLGVQPWIDAAIVFPNADVRVRRPLRGVDFVRMHDLERWVSLARGNAQVAGKLWPEIERIKGALTEL